MATDLQTAMVVLVNDEDEVTGTAEKLEAHVKGLQHRAFSVFLYNKDGQMLLQQRAAGKYHSAGLWTNACCSHPAPEEDSEAAAHRRLREELNMDCALEPAGILRYRAVLDGGLIEHEVDHLFTGGFDGEVLPNPEEVQAVVWKSIPDIEAELNSHPERFTAWFALAFPMLHGKG